MTIQVGEKVPSVNFKTMTDDGPKEMAATKFLLVKRWCFSLYRELLHRVVP